MSKSIRSIQILPHRRQVQATKGVSLLESLMQKSIFLRSDCGGKGICGKCRVHKISDNGRYDAIESCMYTINEDITIKIPETAMQSSHVMTKAPVSFPATFRSGLPNIKTPDSFGIAADIGTTTIAVYLCNIAQGEVVSSLAVKNPQGIYGDDVVSRIEVIGQAEENLEKLQSLVVASIQWGIKKLLASFGENETGISAITVVGNPTMIHILAGINPESIGTSPYEPAFYGTKRFASDRLGFELNNIPVQTLPQVSGFLGGDILAAALAVDFQAQPNGTLLVDLGTNGELLLKNKDKIFATSCATGPAFEGASLSCGMQAIPGAINSIEMGENKTIIRCSTIMGEKPSIKPSGICGAGVLNSIAQFYDMGIIAKSGAFTSGMKEYILVPENKETGQQQVYISQKDIRSVQLGKSALITGIEFLLKKADLDLPGKIIIAGAFGSHLNKLDLITLGMLPEIDSESIEVAGNSAGTGAIMALCHDQYLNKARQMATQIETVNLATNMNFQKAFVKNLDFPEKRGGE